MSAYQVVVHALQYAVDRGIMRHDKYSEVPLKGNLDLLKHEIESSFWLGLGDSGAELV